VADTQRHFCRGWVETLRCSVSSTSGDAISWRLYSARTLLLHCYPVKLIQNFFLTIWRSIWDSAFYKEVLKRKRSAPSLWYLYWLLVVLLFVQLVPLAIGIFQSIDDAERLVMQYKEEAPDFYPEELVVTLSKDGAQTNVREPYTIPLPEHVPKDILEDGDLHFDSIMTINTRASIEDYQDSGSMFLLTKDFFVYPENQRGGYSVLPLKEVMKDTENDMVIDQMLYQDIVSASFSLADKIPVLLVTLGVLLITLAPFFGGFFLWIGQLISLLVVVLILWLLFDKILKRTCTYGSVFRLSLHGTTVPVLLKFFLPTILGFALWWLPGIYLLTWMTVILHTVLPQKSTRKKLAKA